MSVNRKIVVITKLSDDAFNDNHSNGINKGYTKTGYELKEPTIGERYYLGSGFSTSPVTEAVKDGIFKTTYSTYKYEILE